MKSKNDRLYDRIQLVLFFIYISAVFYLFIYSPCASFKYCNILLNAIPDFFEPASFFWGKGFAEFFTICIMLSATLSVLGNIMHYFIFKIDLMDVRFENKKDRTLKIAYFKKSLLTFIFGAAFYFILSWQLPFGESVIGNDSKIIYVSTTTYWFFVLMNDFIRSVALMIL